MIAQRLRGASYEPGYASDPQIILGNRVQEVIAFKREASVSPFRYRIRSCT